MAATGCLPPARTLPCSAGVPRPQEREDRGHPPSPLPRVPGNRGSNRHQGPSRPIPPQRVAARRSGGRGLGQGDDDGAIHRTCPAASAGARRFKLFPERPEMRDGSRLPMEAGAPSPPGEHGPRPFAASPPPNTTPQLRGEAEGPPYLRRARDPVPQHVRGGENRPVPAFNGRTTCSGCWSPASTKRLCSRAGWGAQPAARPGSWCVTAMCRVKRDTVWTIPELPELRQSDLVELRRQGAATSSVVRPQSRQPSTDDPPAWLEVEDGGKCGSACSHSAQGADRHPGARTAHCPKLYSK